MNGLRCRVSRREKKGQGGRDTSRRRAQHHMRSLLPVSALLTSLATASGCGMTGGQLLYFAGVGRGERIPAEFQLTEQPVLILVDDPTARVDYPPLIPAIAEELGQELLRQKAAKRIIPPATLARLRQETPEFEQRGAREVGRLANADQVLWVEVREFLAIEEFSDVTAAAYVSVSLKVLNAREEADRTRVRLWPESPDGRPLNVRLDGATVARLKTRKAIAEELARELAVAAAKLFYDHRLGDLERPES